MLQFQDPGNCRDPRTPDRRMPTRSDQGKEAVVRLVHGRMRINGVADFLIRHPGVHGHLDGVDHFIGPYAEQGTPQDPVGACIDHRLQQAVRIAQDPCLGDALG
jgi:hypothetical protein